MSDMTRIEKLVFSLELKLEGHADAIIALERRILETEDLYLFTKTIYDKFPDMVNTVLNRYFQIERPEKIKEDIESLKFGLRERRLRLGQLQKVLDFIDLDADPGILERLTSVVSSKSPTLLLDE